LDEGRTESEVNRRARWVARSQQQCAPERFARAISKSECLQGMICTELYLFHNIDNI
jgi:hypothetical protein